MSLIWIPLLIYMLFRPTRAFFFSWFITTLNYVEAQLFEQTVATINVISKFVKCMNLLVHYMQRILRLYRVRSDWSLLWKIKIRMLSYIHWLSARKTWCFTALGSTESIDSLDNLIEMFLTCIVDTDLTLSKILLLYDITYSVNIRKI